MSLAVDERRHPSAIRRSEDAPVRLAVVIGRAGVDGEEVIEAHAKDRGGRASDFQVRALNRGRLCQPVERLRVDRKAKALCTIRRLLFMHSAPGLTGAQGQRLVALGAEARGEGLLRGRPGVVLQREAARGQGGLDGGDESCA